MHNSKRWETIQGPITSGLVEEILIHPYSEKHVALRKETETLYAQSPRYIVKTKGKEEARCGVVCTACYLYGRETEKQVIKCVFIQVCVCIKKLWQNRERINESGDL